ncbi:hypothetical protein [Mesorhizobium sp.]|uniref:hypothetical protein n=1 Tax=Mesorhizobium sp. TaxID=1871066 RepID=UPI0025EA1862|nr:hypothetical protein [Mesorhizobium sp.]
MNATETLVTSTDKMQIRLQETMDHLRQDIAKVGEPQLRAMFETTTVGYLLSI